jgi:simple sugar transport system permease protein
MTAGMGWIALAMVIFAAWDPLRTLAGALLFGALYHLAFRLQVWVAPEWLRMLPYVCTLVALILARVGKARHWQGAPAALGEAYVRGERQ